MWNIVFQARGLGEPGISCPPKFVIYP